MSKQLINAYYNQVHAVRRSGATNEGALSMPFFFLVLQYAQQKKYQFHSQITIKSKKTGKNIRPDGILMNELRVHRGFWESKDPGDKIEEEINKKLFKDGYPSSNTLFEDSQTIVLIQGGEEVMRGDMNDADRLNEVLLAFINYKPAEVLEFEKALSEFKNDIPDIVKTFRDLFDEQSISNQKYVQARDRFLELCKEEINPDITEADIREMLIQHILTEDLFAAIFDDASFLRHNIIARELEGLISTVVTREVRQNQLADIKHYYQTLNTTASSIADHNEKQKFLKTVYENFYKVYNPKGADRLGVVYTPNEIVRFMVESTDYLLEKHFNKNLHDKGVEILDPATGTGTFITDIIDYIAPQYLPHKYKHELHANEVSILPYYIANLNIEYTYQNKMGSYASFENICFVDTLDNVDGLNYLGKQQHMFGLNSENAERIKKQNERKISVLIGNPPYNANQQSFNDFNSNREYPYIDKRIKDTYVKQSTAQKTKVYDMYARFYRWAADRLGEDGIIAMVTNRSFVNSRTFDGFRRCMGSEFDHIYLVDLGGDIRQNPSLSGTTHNVFGIQTGVAIAFFVKTSSNKIVAKDESDFDSIKETLTLHKKTVGEPMIHYGSDLYISETGCRIWYLRRPENETAVDKLEFLKVNLFEKLFKDGKFERLRPDKKSNWIELGNTDFDSLLPLVNKDVKLGREGSAVFKLYSLGVVTNRDEWVYDYSEATLKDKVNYLIAQYMSDLKGFTGENKDIIKDVIGKREKKMIKWTRSVINSLSKGIQIKYQEVITRSLYRPFSKQNIYFSKELNEMQYQMPLVFPLKKANRGLLISTGGRIDFAVLATDTLPNLAMYSLDAAQCLPLYSYDNLGNRTDNITDWGLAQFRNNYSDETITKEDIFHYTYAVLHHPSYKLKYEMNLKRDFPRLPLYVDFGQWVAWGKSLMALHVDYETIKPFELKRTEHKDSGYEQSEVSQVKGKLKVKLKADKEAGTIYIDEHTQLDGIPDIAWTYKLGNRSALEWVLDQYKEKKIDDPTIAEKFNTYRFADYKEHVIDLLMRLTRVSVETMEIVNRMPV